MSIKFIWQCDTLIIRNCKLFLGSMNALKYTF